MYKAAPETMKDEIVVLQSKLLQMENDIRMGEVSYADAHFERSQIAEKALALCVELEKITQPKKNYSRPDAVMESENGQISVHGVSGGFMSFSMGGKNMILGDDLPDILEFVRQYPAQAQQLLQLLLKLDDKIYQKIAGKLDEAIAKP